MTQRRTFLAAGATLMGAGLAGCAAMGSGGWVTLVDGATMNSLDGWTQLGKGNWSFVEGTLQGKNGDMGYLRNGKKWDLTPYALQILRSIDFSDDAPPEQSAGVGQGK